MVMCSFVFSPGWGSHGDHPGQALTVPNSHGLFNNGKRSKTLEARSTLSLSLAPLTDEGDPV